jgi:4a-hydroxytetrahydrobiopterin dehydratase
MATLTAAQAADAVNALDGWRLEGNAIRKEFTFRDFPEAVLFVSALVPGAETADHHPDIDIRYKRVTLVFTTHSEGGLTRKDIDGAKAADDIAAQIPHMTDFAEG